MDGLENKKRTAVAITAADIAQPSSEPVTKKARMDDQGLNTPNQSNNAKDNDHEDGTEALAMMMALAAAAQSKSNSHNDEDEYREGEDSEFQDIDRELQDDLVSDPSPEPASRPGRAAPRPPVQHWRVVEKDARQHCPVGGCSQYYVRYRNLEQHIISAHGAEHLKALDGPMEIDDSPKPFLCPAPGCGSRYVRKGDLKVHFLKKHKEMENNFPELLRSKSSKSGKKHACPVPECNCGYMRFGDLRSHFMAHHKERLDDFPEMSGDPDAPSVCRVPNCSIRCSSETALDTHMRIFHATNSAGQPIDTTTPITSANTSEMKQVNQGNQGMGANAFANPMAFGFMNPMAFQMNPMFNPMLFQQMQQLQQMQMQMQNPNGMQMNGGMMPQMNHNGMNNSGMNNNGMNTGMQMNNNGMLPQMNMLPGMMGAQFGFPSHIPQNTNQNLSGSSNNINNINNMVTPSPFDQLVAGAAMMPSFKTDMSSTGNNGNAMDAQLPASTSSEPIREMN